MPDAVSARNAIVNAIMDHAGRATLPFQEAVVNRNCGTAFWYNDLVEDAPDREVIRQYLVTAEELTRFDLAQWTFRDGLCDPQMSAEHLIMRDFADGWIRLEGLGVAVMPTAGLYSHAERKGWRWTTDEITEGLAAHEQDIAGIGADPIPAYVLGHDVGPRREERLQAMVVGMVARDTQGRIRWDRALPEGCAGAPVFVGLPCGDEQFRLVCIGLVLPGDALNEIATFDRIRSAVRALASTPRRRWWRARRR